jgi:hypothetical protein
VVVTVNSKTLTEVTFATSSAATLAAVVQAIELDDDLSGLGITAFVVDGANAIGIVGPGLTSPPVR